MYAASNFGIRAAVRRVEMCPLNDEINSEEEIIKYMKKKNNLNEMKPP